LAFWCADLELESGRRVFRWADAGISLECQGAH